MRARRPVAAAALAGALIASPVAQAQVHGYVSGYLLRTWCESEDPTLAEGCLSYLRGVFDTLQAVGAAAEADGAARRSRAARDVICVPPIAAIGQLRLVYNRFAREREDLLHDQASVLVLDAWRRAFPCPAQ